MSILDVIAAGVRPPEVQPLGEAMQEQRAKNLTLRSMLQKQQMGDMEMQQARQSMADDQIARQAYQESGGDMDKFGKLLMQRGASPKIIGAFQAQQLANQEKRVDIAKKGAEIGHVSAQAAKIHNDAVGQATGALLQLSPESRWAIYPQVRAGLIANGHLSEADAPAQYPGDDWLTFHHKAAMNADQILTSKIAEENAKREAELAPSKLAKSQADAQTSTVEAEQVQRLGMTQQQREQLDARNAEVKKLNTPAELAAVASDPTKTPEERKTANDALRILERHAIASRPVNMMNVTPMLDPKTANLTGDEFLKTLTPPQAAMVKAIAEGRQAPFTGRAGAQGFGGQIMMQVNQYDPTFTAERGALRKAFTTGKQGQNIGALNTATVHLDQFAEAAKAMNNGSFRPGNAVYNAIASEFGATAPTSFEGLKTAVAGELATALKGNATDIEITHISKAIQGKNSPQQLAEYIKGQVHILGAKLNTYKEQYEQKIPGGYAGWNPITPSARAVYDKYGFNPTAGPGKSTQEAGKVEVWGRDASGKLVKQ